VGHYGWNRLEVLALRQHLFVFTSSGLLNHSRPLCRAVLISLLLRDLFPSAKMKMMANWSADLNYSTVESVFGEKPFSLLTTRLVSMPLTVAEAPSKF
jgi:hypothetical protein